MPIRTTTALTTSLAIGLLVALGSVANPAWAIFGDVEAR